MIKKAFYSIFYLISVLLIAVYVFSELTPTFTMSEFGRLFLLGSSCLFLYLGGLFLSKHKNNNKPMKINLWIFFILYLILFLTLTLFDSSWGRNGVFIVKWSKELITQYINTSLNLIPFATITEYIKNFNSLISTNTIFYNLIGNFVCLMPLGFFLPLLFKKQNKPKTFLITTITIVTIVELLQFLTLSGSCDIDDLILNVSGAYLMYRVLKIESIQNLIKNIFLLEHNKIDKKVIYKVLSVFVIIIITLILLIKFRNKLYNQNLDEHTNKYNYDLKIIDEVDTCLDALEEFYEDKIFRYYFNCIKSNEVHAVINDNEKYLVKDLLNNNPTEFYITIDRLKQAGLYFIKEDKYNKIMIEYDFQNYYETFILDENILDINIEATSDGKITQANIYLIPKKSGTTNLEVKIKNTQNKNVSTMKYLIEIDENLIVTYKEIN